LAQPTFLPGTVLDSIEKHAQRAVSRTLDSFESADEDEDTMTGHFGALLQTPRAVRVPVADLEMNGTWRWSISYTKFRGRGPKATEAFTGADGILELHVSVRGEGFRKSALFQAKMHGAGRADLVEQALKLSTFREASFVIDYSQNGITTTTIDEVVKHRGLPPPGERVDFATFFRSSFAECNVGDRDVLYDGSTKTLYWRDMDDNIVEAPFSPKHRLRLTVRAPRPRRRHAPNADISVTPDKIHEHRMRARAEDILGVTAGASATELKTARRKLAQLYHPDRFVGVDAQLRELLNRRMAEMNAAYDDRAGRRSRK
jgi:hypothetical protein